MSARSAEKLILRPIPILLLFSVLLFLGSGMACRQRDSAVSAGRGQSPTAKLPIQDQEKLAERLFSQLSKTDQWDTDTFIKLYTQVIVNVRTRRPRRSCSGACRTFI